MLEYVSKYSKRKDYEDSFAKYERDLKVPYYLIFYPDAQELTLYRHNGRKYVTVRPNDQGRHLIPELDLEVGLLDEWVRFWHRGQLLPLPAELQRELDEAKQRADQAVRQLAREKRQKAKATRRADEEKHRADEEKRRADEEKHRADEEKHRADEEKRRADEEKHRADAAERELARLRAQLAPHPRGADNGR